MLTRQNAKYCSEREFDATFQLYQASLLVARPQGKLLLYNWKWSLRSKRFRRAKSEALQFFAPELHRNACYAGYWKCFIPVFIPPTGT